MDRQPSFRVTVLLLATLMVAIFLCSYTGRSLLLAFGAGLIPVVMLGLRQGLSVKELLVQGRKALWEVRTVFAVIALLGASIAMWLSSGTVGFLMDQGMVLARGAFFLPMIYLLSALCSLMIGTAVGTFSTIGLAFVGMGRAMGIADPLLIGALVSGVFLADRLAPMSGLVNLTVRQAGITYDRFVRFSWKRTVAVMALCTLLYGVLGLVFCGRGTAVAVEASGMAGFTPSLLLWLMPVLMIVMALRGIPTLWTLGAGVAAGFALTVFVQGASVWQAILYLSGGFSSAETVLKGGGVLPMAEVIAIVGMAVVYNQMLAVTGMTQTLLENLTGNCIGQTSFLRRMGGLSILLTSLTCDQTVGILLPLKAMSKGIDGTPIAPEVRAALVADTGILIAPLESWNVNALIIMALTGVSAWQYAPWALFCWLLPLVALIRPQAGVKPSCLEV